MCRSTVVSVLHLSPDRLRTHRWTKYDTKVYGYPTGGPPRVRVDLLHVFLGVPRHPQSTPQRPQTENRDSWGVVPTTPVWWEGLRDST